MYDSQNENVRKVITNRENVNKSSFFTTNNK